MYKKNKNERRQRNRGRTETENMSRSGHEITNSERTTQLYVGSTFFRESQFPEAVEHQFRGILNKNS